MSKMSKTLANILHDPETNNLWLHDNTRDEDNFIHTPDGIVDLGACLQEQGEIVNVLHFGFAITSAELIVAKDKNECLIQIDDDLSFFKDEIARAASFTNKKSAWMRDRLHRRFLCHPQSTLMMAKLFGLTEPLIIGDPDLMAAYLLSKYQQEILKHKD